MYIFKLCIGNEYAIEEKVRKMENKNKAEYKCHGNTGSRSGGDGGDERGKTGLGCVCVKFVSIVH